jgi:hypothetical protein
MKAGPRPERRHAPGYPRKVTLPMTVLTVATVLVAMAGIWLNSSIVLFGSLAIFAVGGGTVLHRTFKRFQCPGCGQRLPFRLPPVGQPFDFHCPQCRILWTTGMDHTEAD